MEVEAKYSVAEDALPTLAEMSTLGLYDLGEGETVTVMDRYLDTPDLRVLRGGYACRLRQRDTAVIATLKSVTPAESEVHTREELEVALDGVEDRPADWPPARRASWRCASPMMCPWVHCSSFANSGRCARCSRSRIPSLSGAWTM